MTRDLGQLLLVGIPGPSLDADTASMLRRVQPGGFILFGRNIASPEQVRRLIDDLRDLSTVEPVITIDQEGGRVSRLRLIGEEPPNAQQLRDKGHAALVRRHGDLTARLLRLFGFNLDLCPVLDISFDDHADNSLRGRCYGRNVAEVVAMAGEFNDALRRGGILSCGKHFPGYSMAGEDPHYGFPSVARSRADLEAHELAVFRHFVPLVDSMMVGHVHYAALEEDVRPASLSPAMITGLLRGELGFRGLVMTDDLDMGAILNTSAARCSARAGRRLQGEDAAPGRLLAVGVRRDQSRDLGSAGGRPRRGASTAAERRGWQPLSGRTVLTTGPQ